MRAGSDIFSSNPSNTLGRKRSENGFTPREKTYKKRAIFALSRREVESKRLATIILYSLTFTFPQPHDSVRFSFAIVRGVRGAQIASV